MRQVDGTLQMLDGKPFGFVVMSESERVYVAPEVLGVSGVSSGAQVAGVAIRCIDRKTGKEGWKVISLSEKARITSNE